MIVIIKLYYFAIFYNKILISYMTSIKGNTKIINFSNICYLNVITFTTFIIFNSITILKFFEYIS